MTEPRTTVVAGVGPGLGESLARRFARGGDRVALIARSADYLDELAAELTAGTDGAAVAAPADVSDPDAVADAFERIRDEFGPVDALVESVYSTRTDSGGILDVDLDEFRGAWAVETAGAFLCAREAARDMVGDADSGSPRRDDDYGSPRRDDDYGSPRRDDDTGDAGTVVFTNSALARRAGGDALARSSARQGLRGLAESMARDLGPRGVHVAHVVVDGWIDRPGLREAFPDRPDERWLDPDAMAETYYHVVEQPRRARGFEVDLRTAGDDLEV